MSDARNLWQRLAAAQGEVDYIQKEKKQGMSYTIVSHDAVTAKVRPVLVKHGVLYHPVSMTHTQNGNRTEVAMTVRFVNVDKPDQFIDVPSLGYGIDNQDKGPGKAISYCVKYALLKALGLETGDDPDLEQNAIHEPASNTNANDAPDPMGKAFNPTKADTRPIKDALCKAIWDCPSKKALEMLGASSDFLTSLQKLNDDFKQVVRESYQDRMKELVKGLAA